MDECVECLPSSARYEEAFIGRKDFSEVAALVAHHEGELVHRHEHDAPVQVFGAQRRWDASASLMRTSVMLVPQQPMEPLPSYPRLQSPTDGYDMVVARLGDGLRAVAIQRETSERGDGRMSKRRRLVYTTILFDRSTWQRRNHSPHEHEHTQRHVGRNGGPPLPGTKGRQRVVRETRRRRPVVEAAAPTAATHITPVTRWAVSVSVPPPPQRGWSRRRVRWSAWPCRRTGRGSATRSRSRRRQTPVTSQGPVLRDGT